MTKSDFQHLLTQLVECLGLAEGDSLCATGVLQLAGHDLHLIHDEVNRPHILQVRLNMGSVAPDRCEWMWYRLLVSNFEWGAAGTLGWGLAPENNHVFLDALCPQQATGSGADLATWLRQLLAAAEVHWRAMLSRQPVADIDSLALLRPAVSSTPAEAGRWDSLIGAFCRYAGLSEHHEPLRDGRHMLVVDGVDMLLRHDPFTHDGFAVVIDLGMDVVLTRETLWQGLLWNNFLVGSSERVLFSVHPSRDAVVLSMLQYMPAHTNAMDFADLLSDIAGHATGFWMEARSAIGKAEAAQRAAQPKR